MARGKEAAAAARRREAEALEAVQRLKEEKAAQKAAYEQEITRLRDELSDMRNRVNEKAAELAGEEIRRLAAEKAEERRAREATLEEMEELRRRKDFLAYQACRYLSMREGVPPLLALRVVFAWITEEDYVGQVTEDDLVKDGFSRDGWPVRVLRDHWRAERAFAVSLNGAPAAYSLDRAEAMKLEEIHPSYQASWWETERKRMDPRSRLSRVFVATRMDGRAVERPSVQAPVPEKEAT